MTTLAFFIAPSQAAEERGFWLMLLVIPTICWLLVRLRKWLGLIAVPIALFTACYCLISVNSAITDRVREGPGYSIPWTRGFPDYGFIALAFAAAALPFIAIRTAYMWPRKGPNKPPQNNADKESLQDAEPGARRV